jgi:lipopolysaccharide transport system ATP-binding protein
MTLPAIDVQHLSKAYQIGEERQRYRSLRDDIAAMFSRRQRRARAVRREFWALKDVTFSVAPGEAVGIVGRNGAGKSTLLKLLSQITPPTGGRITVRGRVASLLEVGTGFHAELTGRENIYLNGAILGMTRREIVDRFDDIVEFAEVSKFLDTPVKHYSSGMYVRLAFSVAAHLEPEILIVDEVLAVGDSAFQRKCLGKMGQVAESGRTILFVSHNLGAVKNLCTRAVLLDGGRVKGIGTTDDIIRQYLDGLVDEAAGIRLGDRDDRLGNGSVRLQAVEIRNAQGQSAGAVQTGDAFHIDFHYTSARPLDDMSVAWNVRDELGQPLFRASSYDTNQEHRDFPASGRVRCTVPRLPLVPGRYHATVEIRVHGVVADYLQSAFVLIVEPGDFYGTGRVNAHSPVLLDHTWQLLDR